MNIYIYFFISASTQLDHNIYGVLTVAMLHAFNFPNYSRILHIFPLLLHIAFVFPAF